MTTLQILVKARRLLSAKKHWTQKTYARDKNGNRAHEMSPKANQWCMLGALHRVSDSKNYLPAMFALQRVGGISNIVTWQDAKTRKHAQVLALIDKTIAHLRRKARKK